MKYSVAITCGFGNIVLSLICLYHLVRKSGLNPYEVIELFEWVDSLYEDRIPFGGHGRKSSRHLGNIFPLINYKNIQKSMMDKDVSACLEYCNDWYTWESIKDIANRKKDKLTDYTVLFTWGFHYQYREEYRQEIIRWLDFGQEIKREVGIFYWENKIDTSKTISLHCRLGSSGGDPNGWKPDLIKYDDTIQAIAYIKRVYPEMDTILVCSEKQSNFEKFITPEIFKDFGLKYVFYDSDAENCIYAMKECAHHIFCNSTLSYCVYYLDEKFPQHSLAIGTYMDHLPHCHMTIPSNISKDGKTGIIHFNQLENYDNSN